MDYIPVFQFYYDWLCAPKNFKEPGDKEKADAVLQVSVVANKEKYDEVRRSTGMCEALRELMKDEIEEE